jgi:hypothetical protein
MAEFVGEQDIRPLLAGDIPISGRRRQPWRAKVLPHHQSLAYSTVSCGLDSGIASHIRGRKMNTLLSLNR